MNLQSSSPKRRRVGYASRLRLFRTSRREEQSRSVRLTERSDDQAGGETGSVPSLAISALHGACFKHDNRQAPNSQTRIKRVIITQGCDENALTMRSSLQGDPGKRVWLDVRGLTLLLGHRNHEHHPLPAQPQCYHSADRAFRACTVFCRKLQGARSSLHHQLRRLGFKLRSSTNCRVQTHFQSCHVLSGSRHLVLRHVRLLPKEL